VLAVGVNKFRHVKGKDLAFAARDAEEIANTLRLQTNSTFQRTFVRTVSDHSRDKPTREQIVRALAFLTRSGPRDTVVLFLASHAVSDPLGNYYFVPADAREEDVRSAEAGGDNIRSLIPWETFFDALRQAAGRRVLIVDTCHAQNIGGVVNPHSLAKRSAASRFALILASKGNEDSQEYEKGRHGLFTYAFLQALRGKGGSKPEFVTLSSAFKTAVPIVEKLRVTPQTPQIVAPSPLGDTVLVGRATIAADR
jgi:uncharacterized caspase-like protein